MMNRMSKFDIDKVAKISTIIGMSLLSIFVIIFIIDKIKTEREYCSSCIPKIVDTYAEKYVSEGIACIRSDKCNSEKIHEIAKETQEAFTSNPCFVKCTRSKNPLETIKKREPIMDAYLKKIDVLRELRH